MNEQSRIYPMPPADLTDLAPSDAEVRIKEVMAAASQDPQHPYSNLHHGLHKDYTTYMGKLFEIKGPDPSPLEKVMEADLERREVAQAKLAEEIGKEVAELRKMGFEGEGPSDDVQPYHLTALRMQRLAAEENFAALEPMIGKELQVLKVPAAVQQMFSDFNVADLDSELKGRISEEIIRWIHDANKRRYGKMVQP